MSARDSIDIATAALRWHTARERRLVAGAEKRRAEMLSRSAFLGVTNSMRADALLAECKRQERAAVRALAKACAKARNDLQAVDVLEAEPVRRPKSRAIAGTSPLHPQGGRSAICDR